MTDRLDDEIISDLIAQGNIVGIRMKRLKDELERVTAERDSLKAKLERTHEHNRKAREDNDKVEQEVFNELSDTCDRLRTALEVAKRALNSWESNNPTYGLDYNARRALAEIERIESSK